QFRAIGARRQTAAQTAAKTLAQLRNHSIFDEIPFIAEKTDILAVEDYTSGAMENPGLITFNTHVVGQEKTHTHEFAHMYFGNLVTLSTWNDVWVNEGLATFFQ
ncbi:hypothetical protein PMAYCL1PPCAC_32278, partial [Pristionchus mayeri]